MRRRWNINTPDSRAVQTISKYLGCHRAVAAAMVNRKITEPGDAEKYLSPSLGDLNSPFALKDMDKAVHRIMQAIVNREKILVLGDYDADGVCSTALLTEFLAEAGADVSYHIPHRIEEGYGFTPDHVEGPVKNAQAGLVVTVDNGISSSEAVEASNNIGVDVIVTDHHTPPPILPSATAVVDPKLEDCPAGLSHLAGVGVAFYLCICLRKAIRDQGMWPETGEPNLKRKCDLVAVGTVADMVPLVRENRILVHSGLEVMTASMRPGLKALMDLASVDSSSVSVHDIAFRLAPRINAAGRVAHAACAVELLLAKTDRQARKLAGDLDDFNRKRQKMSEDLHRSVLSLVRSDHEIRGRKSLVLARAGWHPGVIGIAAAKAVNEFNCPVVLISMDGDFGKGSARSVPGCNLYDALYNCSSFLESFGGHAQAAGLTVKASRLEEFRRAFDQKVIEGAANIDFQPVLDIDCLVSLNELGPDFVDQVTAMAPFGVDNPEPVFASNNVAIRKNVKVGRGHRKMVWAQGSDPGSKSIQAIWFNVDGRVLPAVAGQAAFRIQWNRWRDKISMQAVVEGIREM